MMIMRVKMNLMMMLVYSARFTPPLLTHSGAYIRGHVHPWKVGVIVPRGPLEVAEPMKS